MCAVTPSLALFNVFGEVNFVVFKVIMPVTALIINIVLVVQVRRAAIHSAANLGVQPHHHQSSSAVPAVMLIATSLVYVILHTMPGLLVLIAFIQLWMTGRRPMPMGPLDKCANVFFALSQLIYAYNFYVYLITGKLFRSDLQQLFSRCPSWSCFSCSSSSPAADVDTDDAHVVRRVKADAAV